MIDLPLTFDEAMIALKSEEIMQPLLSSVTNRASWGIYTYTRENARALYIAMEGLDEITDTIQEAEFIREIKEGQDSIMRTGILQQHLLGIISGLARQV